MLSPTIKPAVATPRSQLKRKHGEIVDDDHRESGGVEVGPGHLNGNEPSGGGVDGHRERQLGDDDFSSGDDHDDESDDDEEDDMMLEDALDTIELEPYRPSNDDAVTISLIAKIRAELRARGPKEFIERYLETERSRLPPDMLGCAFGLDPAWELEEDFWFRLVKKAIIRAYHKRQKLTQYNTIDDAAQLLKSSKKIMVITGAGISTSLGIPDFRSKTTGFYDRVKALGLAEGEEVFDIHEFDNDPTKFYSLAGDILPDLKRYSPTHAFIRLLQDEGRLQTNYTQNIDNLEQLAGIESSRLIQCHGSFATASCRKCKRQVPGSDIFPEIRAKRVARCAGPGPAIKKRKSTTKLKRNDWEDSSDSEGAYDVPQAGVMKPDITFFGEQLPDRFFSRFTEQDSKSTDLVIVMGTSLKVAPVSEISHHLPARVPHIYISREPIEHVNFDIQLLGDCDHVVFELCRRAGWKLEHEMIPQGFRVKVRPVEESTYRWRVTPRSAVQNGGTLAPVAGPTSSSSRLGTPVSRAGTPASPSPSKSKASVRDASRSPRPLPPVETTVELRPFYEKYLGKI